MEYLNLWVYLREDDPHYLEYPIKTRETADIIFDQQDSDLSTENLHCDCEISLSEANAKLKKILAIAKKLQWSGFGIDSNSELGSYMQHAKE